MKWSWKLGEVAGIGVYMHATFLLLIGGVALSHWTEGRNLAATLAGVACLRRDEARFSGRGFFRNVGNSIRAPGNL